MADYLRKKPVQERSIRRYNAILDAAGALFADRGLDATTMEAIAARAETSIGSVYQYFPDKRAVYTALAERELERSRGVFDAFAHSVNEHALPAWEDFIAQVIDGFALMRTDPAYLGVVRHVQVFGDVAEADRALHEELIQRSEAIVRLYAPRMGDENVRRVTTMVVDIISAALYLATQRDDARARELLDETKLVLARYLRPYIDEHGG